MHNKLSQEFLDEEALLRGYQDFSGLVHSPALTERDMKNFMSDIAYKCCKATLDRLSQAGVCNPKGEQLWIDKEAVSDPKNIVIL